MAPYHSSRHSTPPRPHLDGDQIGLVSKASPPALSYSHSTGQDDGSEHRDHDGRSRAKKKVADTRKEQESLGTDEDLPEPISPCSFLFRGFPWSQDQKIALDVPSSQN